MSTASHIASDPASDVHPGPPAASAPRASRQLGEVERKCIVDTYAALRAGIPGFRVRRAQSQMIGACSRALGNPGGAALIEAGTGTGKSLAYLTAGMTLAQLHGLKLLVATGTVGLQEQLTNRDIPMFTEATRVEGTAVIAKGRNRYACPRNMQLLCDGPEDQGALFSGLDEDLAKAGSWPRPPRRGEADRVQKLSVLLERGSWNGELDNPPLPVDEALWPLLTTGSAGCAGRSCAFFRSCPYYRARTEVDKASVIVANQALLLADLQIAREDGDGWGGVLLPRLEDCLVVIDEGHQLARTAIGASASSAHLSLLVRRTRRWQTYIRAAFIATGRQTVAAVDVYEAIRLLNELEAALKALESDIRMTWTPDPRDGMRAGYRAPHGGLPEGWQDRARAVKAAADELLRVVKGLRHALSDADGLEPGAGSLLPREIGTIAERLEELSTVMYWWGRAPDPEADGPPIARWVQLAGHELDLVACCSPTSAAGMVRSRIFGQAAGTVVTSATLASGGDFRLARRQLGLPEHGETLALESPFDHANQAVLQVPWIQAAPNDVERHAREVADWMERELDPTAGNLVLFNSRAKMTLVAGLVEGPLKDVLRVQHTRPKAELLAEHAKAMQAGTGSTLFGLAGLGEGTDLPGDLCTSLVVVNLPFRVPTDPVEATFAEWLETRGRRPFEEVTVPQAIRVLTQYVGRLLRHEDDRGRVVILDRRIVDRPYGRRMLDALPPFRREIETRPRQARVAAAGHD